MVLSSYIELTVDNSTIVNDCITSDEAYKVEVQEKYVKITGASSAGVFYGIQVEIFFLGLCRNVSSPAPTTHHTISGSGTFYTIPLPKKTAQFTFDSF